MNVNKKIVVVKYGSKCLVDKAGLDQARIDDYAGKIADLRQDYEVLVVTSGSVAAGQRFWPKDYGSQPIPDAQVLSSIGSAGANEAWRLAFKQQDLLVAQVLITHREIEDQKEGDNLILTLQKLFSHGVVPVVNENDLLSNKELKKLAYGGDNDGLASHLTVKLSAAAVLLLTDTEGYLEQGRVRRQVKQSQIENLQYHLQAANEEGTGSMRSKLNAAARAAAADSRAFIANAETPNYQRVLDGQVGTEVIK